MVEYAAVELIRARLDGYVGKEASESTVLGVEGIRRHADFTNHLDVRAHFGNAAFYQSLVGRRAIYKYLGGAVDCSIHGVAVGPRKVLRERSNGPAGPYADQRHFLDQFRLESHSVADRRDIQEGSLGTDRHRIGNRASSERDIDPNLPPCANFDRLT